MIRCHYTDRLFFVYWWQLEMNLELSGIRLVHWPLQWFEEKSPGLEAEVIFFFFGNVRISYQIWPFRSLIVKLMKIFQLFYSYMIYHKKSSLFIFFLKNCPPPHSPVSKSVRPFEKCKTCVTSFCTTFVRNIFFLINIFMNLAQDSRRNDRDSSCKVSLLSVRF